MKIGYFTEYKGFTGSIEFSIEDGIHFGCLQNISDIVCYHAKTVEELFEKYNKAVDEYIETVNSLNLGDVKAVISH